MKEAIVRIRINQYRLLLYIEPIHQSIHRYIILLLGESIVLHQLSDINIEHLDYIVLKLEAIRKSAHKNEIHSRR